MSRIGKKEIAIPAGVTVTPSATSVEVKSDKGSLTFPVFPEVKVEVEGQGEEESKVEFLLPTKGLPQPVRGDQRSKGPRHNYRQQHQKNHVSC